MSQKIRVIKYKCSKCGSQDSDKLFENENIAPAINCWSCKAGYGKDMGTMLSQNIGMFPVTA